MRNSFLSFSSVLVLTLLMFFINILFLLHDVSFRIIDGVNDKLTISLYLEEGYNKNSGEVIGLLGEIGQGFPNIEAIYKTKEQVLNEIREQDPNLVKILERQNPLPETISLNNIALEQFSQLNTIIQSKQDILAQSQE
jgi:cell division protein FtsX